MPVQRYTVCLRDGLWEVWLGGRLIAGQPSEMGAVALADALSYAAAIRGERSGPLVGATAADNGGAWARRLRSGDEEAPPERAQA